MTAPGEPHRDQPGPWQPYQHPPVDPHAPVDYPNYPPPPPYSGPPPYSYPPPPYGAPSGYPGYGAPPPAPPYDPYQPYGVAPQSTNGLATASLITSIAGIFLGIPLAIFCLVGWLIPVAGAAMGVVALNQIKRTGEQGRGLAIAGITIGAITAAFVVLFWLMYTAAAMHVPVFAG